MDFLFGFQNNLDAAIQFLFENLIYIRVSATPIPSEEIANKLVI
jgi:hypothetical protein